MDDDVLPVSRLRGTPLIAEVAVDGAFAFEGLGILSYEVPAELRDRVAERQLAWVPLRKKVVLGIVTALHQAQPEFKLRPISALVEPEFRLSQDQLDIAAWISRETASTMFDAASPYLPPGATHRAIEWLRLSESAEMPEDLTPAQRKVVAYLKEHDEAPIEAVRQALRKRLTTVIAKLERCGVVERSTRVVDRLPKERSDRYIRLLEPDREVGIEAPSQKAVVDYLALRRRLGPAGGSTYVPLRDVLDRTGTDHGVVSALARKGVIEAIDVPKPRPVAVSTVAAAPELTAEQSMAWRTIEQALVDRRSRPILIHGVTGSGKTELYLRAVAWCLRHGRSAIVLVPEIALASQVVRRFTARFPGRVGVLHSAMPDSQRFARWQAIAVGQHDVVVGPRSALFAPVCDLGLIVIDEEHEGAYKQESEPRYKARALAEMIAQQQRAVVLFGSATPSVETYRRAEIGEIGLLELKARVDPLAINRDTDGRVGELDLPNVEIVDMRLELHRGNTSLFSERLTEFLVRTLKRREQAMLLLNRRGTSTIVICRSCGDVVNCPFCDVSMVYHQDRGRLLCHRCNHRQFPPQACASCSGQLDYFGAGTQRVEAEVKRLLPEARVLRWDQDSVRRHGGHDVLLNRIEKREVDIVVGTQMIAKGFDLPMVTAIGVVHADTMLHLPDFRSGERTFQLLTQVAGRAGRRAPGGAVVIQSYTPDHYAIQAAARHDFHAFYVEEIDFRRMHGFPPFTRLVRYLYRHQNEEECAVESEDMARDLGRHIKRCGAVADLLGPTPAFASRIRGKYQWQIVLRANPADMERLLDGLPIRPGWWVDVDPQSML